MSIFLDRSSRVVVQGITGRMAQFHAKDMLEYGTNVVAGVVPGKGGETVMGVPVFNLLLGVPAGFLMGRRLMIFRAGEEHINQLGRWTQVFTTSVLGLFCLASAVLALGDPSTGANLRGMLGLGF